MASLEDFDVLDELGRGGQAITWRARHKASGDLVALKELHFQRVEGWKTVELFEREAAALASLDHPDIPDYRGAFSDEKDGELTLYLAQELVDGQNLLDELEREGRWSADKATADLARLLEVLIYLASRVPPVVHRDIKPENLIRRPDGGISLVDFGAVYIDEGVTHSSTVIGTPGYMALEQMTGQAVPCSDLYSLGVTFGHLMTGLSPSQIRLVRARLDFRAHLDEETHVLDVVERMTAPGLEDRFISARRALEALQRPGPLHRVPGGTADFLLPDDLDSARLCQGPDRPGQGTAGPGRRQTGLAVDPPERAGLSTREPVGFSVRLDEPAEVAAESEVASAGS